MKKELEKTGCPGCLANKPCDLETETRKFISKMGIDKEDWEQRMAKFAEEFWERDVAMMDRNPTAIIKEHADVAIVAMTMYLKARDELATLGVDPDIEMLTKMAEVLAR